MIRLWLSLRRIRHHAAPRPDERGAIEAFLKTRGAFEQTRSTPAWLRVGSGVVAAVLVLGVSVGSYAYASEAVLPDTPLYPVRAAIEQVEVVLAMTPAQKEKVEEKLEVRRLKEVEKLHELKRPVPAPLKKYAEVISATSTKEARKQVLQQKKIEREVKREQKRQAVEQEKILRKQEQEKKRQERQRQQQERRAEQQKQRQEREKQRQEKREAARREKTEQK